MIDALSDKALIPIQILPMPDAPIIHGTKYFHMREDTAEQIFGMKIIHVDVISDLYVSIKCTSGGKVILNTSEGLTVMTNNGSINGTGSVDAWNNALEGMSYIPERNWNNDDRKIDEVRFEVRDIMADIEDDHSTHVIHIRIEGEPDPHHWKIMNSQSYLYSSNGVSDSIEVAEDSGVTLQLSLLDADVIQPISVDKSYSVHISTSSGLLHLSNYNGIFLNNGSHGSSLLDFDARFTSINNAINKLLYIPAPNFNGYDTIYIHSSDEEGFFNYTLKIPIIILPEYDLPTIRTATKVYQCWEGKVCSLSNAFSMEDPDSNSKLSLQVKSKIGIMSFAGGFELGSRGVTMISTSPRSGGNLYVLEGSGVDLNFVLSKLIYHSYSNIAPTVDLISISLHVVTMDNQENPDISTVEAYVYITETNDNPAPSIRYNQAIYHDDETCPSSFHLANNSDHFCKGFTEIPPIYCLEGDDCVWNMFSVTGGDQYEICELELSVQHGSLFFNGTATGIIQLPVDRSYFHIQGDVYNLNEALHNLIYKQEDFIAKDTAHFTISTRAKSEQLFQPVLHSLEVEVLVSGFDHIQLIGPYNIFFVDEDIFIAISGISLHYVFNSGSNVNIQAVLKLSNGKGYFRNTPQYEGTIDYLDMSKPAFKNESTNHKNNNTWTDVTICGDAGIIAKWLSSISFVSNKNWNSPSNGGEYANLNIGVKRIEICVMEDLLDTPQVPQSNNEFEDDISVLIHVNPVNDNPEIIIDKASVRSVCSPDDSYDTYDICINEDQEVTITTTIIDVDDDIMQIDVWSNNFGKVAVSHGNEYFNDVYFIEGDGTGDYYEHITFKGTLSSVKEYLQNLQFRGVENYNGNDAVMFIEAKDHFGGRTSLQLDVSINPVQDALLLWFVVDSGLAQPVLILFNPGEKNLLGGEWLERGDSYMEALSPLGTLNEASNEKGKIRPLPEATGRVFSIMNGYAEESSPQYNICVKISVDKGFLFMDDATSDKIEGITVNHLPHNNEIVYSGKIDVVNDATETIAFQPVEDQTGNVDFRVDITRETCQQQEDYDTDMINIVDDTMQQRCECDFQGHRSFGDMTFFVKDDLFLPYSIDSLPKEPAY